MKQVIKKIILIICIAVIGVCSFENVKGSPPSRAFLLLVHGVKIIDLNTCVIKWDKVSDLASCDVTLETPSKKYKYHVKNNKIKLTKLSPNVNYRVTICPNTKKDAEYNNWVGGLFSFKTNLSKPYYISHYVGKKDCLYYTSMYIGSTVQLYRSNSINGKYKKVGKAKKVDRYGYVEIKDKSCKKGKVYYYKARTLLKIKNKTYHSKFSKPKRVVTKK